MVRSNESLRWSSGSLSRKEARFAQIRDHLIAHGSATIDELVALTGASRMTIHRDLDELNQSGALRRTRGGASAQKSLLFEADVQVRMALAHRAKEAIGRKAVELIEPGQVLLLDDSTTSLAFFHALPRELPITVATNFFRTIEAATARPNTHLIALGGDYQPNYQAFFGLVTETALTAIHADVLVASSSALRGLDLYHQSQLVIGARRAMMESSAIRVLLIDSSKIGQSALYRYGSVNDFDHVIVDSGVLDDALEVLRESTAEIHVVDV